MMKIIKSELFVILLFFIAVVSCKEESNPVQQPPDTSELKLTDKAKIFAGHDFTKYFLSFSQDSSEIVFDAAVKERYKLTPGDIIASYEGRGYIAKVTGVQDNGGTITVQTTVGSICEAIEQGSAEFQKTFNLSNARFKLRKNVKLLSIKTINAKPTQKPNGIEMNFEVLLYDADDNPETTNDQIELFLKLSLSPTVMGKVVILGEKISRMYFKYDLVENFETTLQVPSAAVPGTIENELNKSLGSITFSTFLFGALPIAVTPELELNAGANINLKTALTTVVKQNQTYAFTMNYLGGDKWETTEEHTSDFGYDKPIVTSNAEAEAYVTPRIFFKVYQYPSPYISTRTYSKFEADTNINPWWKMNAGLNAEGGVKMKVWNSTLSDFKTNLLSLDEQIAHAESGYNNYITITNPNYTTVWQSGDEGVSIEWDPGNTGGNVKIELFNGNDLAKTISESASNIGVFNDWNVPVDMATGADFKIKVTSLDNSDNCGYSPAFEIFSVNNRPPNEPNSPIPPDGVFNQLYDLALSWRCEDPDNDPLTYDVYFGLNDDPPLAASGIYFNSFNPGSLTLEKIYYWKIVARDNNGNSTEGKVWMFSTIHAKSNQSFLKK